MLFGFLCHALPGHVAHMCAQTALLEGAGLALSSLLLELARAVHSVVTLLPPSLVEEGEGEELLWEPTSEGGRV